MATFERAIPHILLHEGGFVNHPNDPGGATNFGISLRFLRGFPQEGDLNRDGRVDIEDIVNMTREQASQIYRRHWWDRYQYGRINDQTIATKVFDLSVNMGADRAHRLLQTALNNTFGLRLTVDGVLGNASFVAINAVGDGDEERRLLTAYADEAWRFYERLIERNPRLSVFRNGWRNRAYALTRPNSVS
jgi:lysozyme family protein